MQAEESLRDSMRFLLDTGREGCAEVGDTLQNYVKDSLGCKNVSWGSEVFPAVRFCLGRWVDVRIGRLLT